VCRQGGDLLDVWCAEGDVSVGADIDGRIVLAKEAEVGRQLYLPGVVILQCQELGAICHWVGETVLVIVENLIPQADVANAILLLLAGWHEEQLLTLQVEMTANACAK